MSRLVSLLRTALFVAVCAGLLGAQTAQARFAARALPTTISQVFDVPATVRPGEAFDVSIAQPSTLSALDVFFTFDPAFIELVSVELAPGTPDAIMAVEGVGGDHPDFLAFWMNELAESDRPLVIGRFRALAPTSSTPISVVLLVDGGDSDGGYTTPALTRDVAVVPEPAVGWALLVGLCGVGLAVRGTRRR
ncbi:MAG: hypothetical protein MUF30_06410 [Burkholderiales bacterium]|jgi:hypothetical protein|nr:hypothetical protein [Burkholderiales bacterium]